MTTRTLMHTLTAGALAALLMLASPARAEVEVEVNAGFGGLILTSDTTNLLLPERGHGIGFVGVRLQPHEIIGVELGFRGWAQDHSRPDGLSTELEAYTVSAAATARYRLVWHLYFVGALGFEAQAAALRLHTGGEQLDQTAWAFGFHPQAGLELSFPIAHGDAHLRVRLQGGYVLQTDLDYDALEASSGRVAPLDFGAANLSGATFGVTFAAAF